MFESCRAHEGAVVPVVEDGKSVAHTVSETQLTSTTARGSDGSCLMGCFRRS